ncbi:MAG: antirepressor regulating drug resistance protein [Eubacterium sp.]|nr:antirepressor regulating drug resistance protein [Eubacterium sp.]
MLNTVFYSILNMSVTAAIIGLLIMVLRKIRLIPRLGIYCLWTLVLLKLLIPFSVSSNLSLLNLVRPFIKKVVSVPGIEEDSIKVSMTNSIGTAETYFPVTYKTQQLESLFGAAASIWIIGVLSSIIIVSVLYYLANRQLGSVIPIRDNIFTGEKVEVPLVHGIFRQCIIVPEMYLNDLRLKYIVLHEQIHVRRHDNLLRVLAVITACFHWFNPFVWIFLKRFIDDMELTCDLAAVKKLSADERKRYAGTLVEVASGHGFLMSAAFGKSNVKVRVMNVLTYKKLSVLALTVTLIFVAALSAILLTNPIR